MKWADETKLSQKILMDKTGVNSKGQVQVTLGHVVHIGGFYRNITSVLLHALTRLRGRRGCWDGIESGGKSRLLVGQIL